MSRPHRRRIARPVASDRVIASTTALAEPVKSPSGRRELPRPRAAITASCPSAARATSSTEVASPWKMVIRSLMAASASGRRARTEMASPASSACARTWPPVGPVAPRSSTFMLVTPSSRASCGGQPSGRLSSARSGGVRTGGWRMCNCRVDGNGCRRRVGSSGFAVLQCPVTVVEPVEPVGPRAHRALYNENYGQ